jgi:DNA-binding beta-propeller fold protein YncE
MGGRVRKGLAIGVLAGSLAAAWVSAAFGTEVYRLAWSMTLPGKSPSWDHPTYDARRGLLFVGRRKDGVTVVDVRHRKVVGHIRNSEGANIAALVPQVGRGFTANEDGSTTVFDLANLKTLARIKLGGDADAAFYDAATGQVVFTRGDSHELTFLDARTNAVTARLHLESSQLEGLAVDGAGLLYVAERDTAKVAKVDARSHTLVAEWPLAGCQMPTGLALDASGGRLFAGCKGERPVLTVVNVTNGAVVAQPPIGRGNDGVIFDARTHRVLTSNGVDGNLVIFDQLTPDSYKLEQAVTTRPLARTMDLDPATGRIFTMTAEGMVDPSKPVNRKAGEFYPNTYFDNTFTLFEYAPRALAASAPEGD